MFHVTGVLISQCGISEICISCEKTLFSATQPQTVQKTLSSRGRNPLTTCPNQRASFGFLSLSLSLSLYFLSPKERGTGGWRKLIICFSLFLSILWLLLLFPPVLSLSLSSPLFRHRRFLISPKLKLGFKIAKPEL